MIFLPKRVITVPKVVKNFLQKSFCGPMARLLTREEKNGKCLTVIVEFLYRSLSKNFPRPKEEN